MSYFYNIFYCHCFSTVCFKIVSFVYCLKLILLSLKVSASSVEHVGENMKYFNDMVLGELTPDSAATITSKYDFLCQSWLLFLCTDTKTYSIFCPMQRSFYGSALKYMKLRPLVFRRIIVWHCLLFSAWVRWDCFGGKQNNIIGSESLLPKATHSFKILCITFTTFWTGSVCQAYRVLFIVSLYVEGHACGTCEFDVTCLIYSVTSHPFFYIFCVFVSDWEFVVVFVAPNLWCVATVGWKLLCCVLASKKEGSK